MVRVGRWAWDATTGEENRVGAGMADPYGILWCAVEYFEGSGSILSLLLQHVLCSTTVLHLGRNLLHHAILCGSTGAVKLLLAAGIDVEFPVTTFRSEFRPVHMAARLGLPAILQCLIESGAEINSRTSSGDTALTVGAKFRQEPCLRLLTAAGADFGLANLSNQTVASVSRSNKWWLGFQHTVLDLIRSGIIPKSTNLSAFCCLLFVAQAGDVEAARAVLDHGGISIDHQDDDGFSAVMLAAINGHAELFRLLIYSGADVRIRNNAGETAISLFESNPRRDQFEKIMLEFALHDGHDDARLFPALHCAARRGDAEAIGMLLRREHNVDLQDRNGHTPLMLAAMGDHKTACELLISHGAECRIKNHRGDTALSLAKSCGAQASDSERVIADEMARRLVLQGESVQKHTKMGKGVPHLKKIVMVGETGVLRWGTSRRRNVVCRDAMVGPSTVLSRNRRKLGDAHVPGVFRVLTTKNKEVHFVCEGGSDAAQMWVRGIKLVTRKAICG